MKFIILNPVIKKIFIFCLISTVLQSTSASDFQDIDNNRLKKAVAKITAIHSDNTSDIGAGTIISYSQSEMYIVTAYHVVENARRIVVEFYDHPGKQYEGRLFDKIDRERDIAIVIIDNYEVLTSSTKFNLGGVSSVDVLDRVYALGHPYNYSWELSSGEIRSVDLLHFRFSKDAVNSGNSGGPLLNNQNELIGIITHIRGGNGFALKIDHVTEILKIWGISVKILTPVNFCASLAKIIDATQNNYGEFVKSSTPRITHSGKEWDPIIDLTGGDGSSKIELNNSRKKYTYMANFEGSYNPEIQQDKANMLKQEIENCLTKDWRKIEEEYWIWEKSTPNIWISIKSWDAGNINIWVYLEN